MLSAAMYSVPKNTDTTTRTNLMGHRKGKLSFLKHHATQLQADKVHHIASEADGGLSASLQKLGTWCCAERGALQFSTLPA